MIAFWSVGTYFHGANLILPNFPIPRAPTASVPIPEVQIRIRTEGGLHLYTTAVTSLCYCANAIALCIVHICILEKANRFVDQMPLVRLSLIALQVCYYRLIFGWL